MGVQQPVNKGCLCTSSAYKLKSAPKYACRPLQDFLPLSMVSNLYAQLHKTKQKKALTWTCALLPDAVCVC